MPFKFIFSIIVLLFSRSLCCNYFNEPFLRNEQKIEGKLIRFLSQNSTVSALTTLQDGNLASANGQIINIWNYTNGKLLKSFVAHNRTIGSLLVLSNGDLTSMSSNVIKIWNSTSFVLKKNIFIGGSILKNKYEMLLSSLSNDFLVIGSIDGIEVFDPTNGTLISNFTADSICCTQSMATFDDYLTNKLIVFSFLNFTMSSYVIKIWNPIQNFFQGPSLENSRLRIGVLATFNNEYLAGGCLQAGSLYIWSLFNGKLINKINIGPANSLLIFLPNRLLVSSSRSNFIEFNRFKRDIKIVDPLNRSLLGIIEIYDEWIDSLIVLPNGYLAGGSFSGIAFWKLEGQTFTSLSSLSSTKLSRSSTTSGLFNQSVNACSKNLIDKFFLIQIYLILKYYKYL